MGHDNVFQDNLSEGVKTTAIPLMKLLYKSFLRKSLLNMVKSTDNKWDDYIIVVCDAVFGINSDPLGK